MWFYVYVLSRVVEVWVLGFWFLAKVANSGFLASCLNLFLNHAFWYVPLCWERISFVFACRSGEEFWSL